MRKILAFTALSLALALSATAQERLSATYEVTITNNLAEELLAPFLVAPAGHDDKIFVGNYVSPEAEIQILTGDPAPGNSRSK